MLTFTLLVFGLAWTARATPVGNHTCTGVVKHPVTVRVNVTEPVTFRSYTWCLRVPPRCSQYTIQLKDRIKIHTEMHNRTITVCCAGYVEIDYNCVPACPPQTECPNMHCNRTNHCYCTPGYTGLYCSQPCPKGLWGPACQKPCDCPPGYTCHHLTGDCMIDDSPSTKPKRTTVVTNTLSTLTSPPIATTVQISTSSTTPRIQSSTEVRTPSTTPRTETPLSTSPPVTVHSSTARTVAETSAYTVPEITKSKFETTPTSSTEATVVTTSTRRLSTASETPTTSPGASSIFEVSSRPEPTTNRSPHTVKTSERPDQSETADFNLFAPPRGTTPSLKDIVEEATSAIATTLKTPPAIFKMSTPVSERITSTTEEFILTPPSSTAHTVQTSTSKRPTNPQTMPTTETPRTTPFTPFRTQETSPSTPDEKLRTTLKSLTQKSPPTMHVISKTSDGRLILTNVVDTSSNANATSKKSSLTNPPPVLFNQTWPTTLPTGKPTESTTEYFKTPSPSTFYTYAPKPTKSPENVTIPALNEGSTTTSAPTIGEAKITFPSTSPKTTPHLFTSPYSTGTSKSTSAGQTSRTDDYKATNRSTGIPSTLGIVEVSHTTPLPSTPSTKKKTQRPSSSTSMTTTLGTTLGDLEIKTFLPKFNLDKDDSLEFAKVPQKPTKVKEKIQKKYKSKVDSTSILSTSQPSSQKPPEDNHTNNVFLETTEFKVHLASTRPSKNSDLMNHKATTKTDTSDEDLVSSRPSKKRLDKLAKVLEEASSRPPITLRVSTSTPGLNAAHTWYSHLREKAKAKNSRQQKSTTPVTMETSSAPEESNDIDSLADPFTASQGSKNGNFLRDEFNHANLKFNSSMNPRAAGVQAVKSAWFDLNSVAAVIGGSVVVLSCCVLVGLLFIRLRTKRSAAIAQPELASGDASYDTVYPVHDFPGATEAMTFFCPTFTNNYAEKMKRDASEFNYDQPKTQLPEPFYAEIRH